MHDSSVFESRVLASRFGSDLLIHKDRRIKNNMGSENGGARYQQSDKDIKLQNDKISDKTWTSSRSKNEQELEIEVPNISTRTLQLMFLLLHRYEKS